MHLRRPLKRLLLKLGTKCNLECPHCHQAQKNFKEHPGLVDWIIRQGFDRITFSGGEPLLYFDIVRRIMSEVGTSPTYRMMSNATLLTDDIVDFTNKYKFIFGVSYDGVNGGRDLRAKIRWDQVLKRNSFGMSTVFSTPEFSFKKFSRDFESIRKKYKIEKFIPSDMLKINWIHQTDDAPNQDFGVTQADSYIEQSIVQLEKALYCMHKGRIASNTVLNLIGNWYPTYTFDHGVTCCNEYMWNVNLDGVLTVCPYGTKDIGTIDAMPSFAELDNLVPDKCKGCECWEACRCSCVASITGLDCYISKIMIPKVRELLEKYDAIDKVNALLAEL